MVCDFSMFACMLIRRTIAAQGYAAFLTGTQVHPTRPDFDAFLADSACRLFDISDRIDMSACFHRYYLLALNNYGALGYRQLDVTTKEPRDFEARTVRYKYGAVSD
jgi:hypothetical protein